MLLKVSNARGSASMGDAPTAITCLLAGDEYSIRKSKDE